jgi:UDP-GlcNAc:undecaprenyl-phosphate GlcNAc-1-phosphate transferase
MHLIELFLGGIIAGLLCALLAIKFFPKIGLLDFPERYGLKRDKIPYPGGIVLALLGILICTYFQWYGLAGIIGITGIISFLDDKFQLPATTRLATQLLIAGAIAIVFGIQIQQTGNPFGEGMFLLPPILSLGITIIWLILVQNALNWFDGLKGLCVGVSGIGFLALGLFGLIRPEVAWETTLPAFLNITFSLAGICIGAWFLFFKGKILLGDTGSQVLGLLLGIFSIVAGTKIATTLLVLGLPLLDAAVVVLRRIFLDKKSPLKGDQRHLHHALTKRIGEKNAVLLLLAISAFLGLGSIFLPGWGKMLGVIIVGGTLLFVHFKK